MKLKKTTRYFVTALCLIFISIQSSCMCKKTDVLDVKSQFKIYTLHWSGAGENPENYIYILDGSEIGAGRHGFENLLTALAQCKKGDKLLLNRHISFSTTSENIEEPEIPFEKDKDLNRRFEQLVKDKLIEVEDVWFKDWKPQMAHPSEIGVGERTNPAPRPDPRKQDDHGQ
jgi:hypothetical protein